MHPEIIGIGLAIRDHFITVPEFPSEGGLISSSHYEVQGGGAIATALIAAQSLGASTEFWGRVGDDENGHAILKELKSYGVGTSQLHIIPDGKTGLCFVLVKAGQGQRATIVHSQKNLFVDSKSLHLERIKKCKVVLIDATWVEAAHQSVQFARIHGVPVVSNIHDPGQASLDLLGLSDYAIIPRQLAEVLAAGGDYTAAVHELKARGVKVPIVMLGEEGCFYLYQNKLYRHPAFQVETVDPASAGDCFHGAFCFGLVRGLNVPEAVTFASAAAALTCTHSGGRGATPTYEETIQFMRGQRKKA